MKLFIIIATMLACTYAAPAVELTHPSPVNPSVLVAVKPEEKIELITDPKEIAKFKRELKQPLYPTILPQEHEHHITKRDCELSHKKRDIPVPLVAKHYHPEESSNEKEAPNDAENRTIEGYQKPQTLPLILKDILPDAQQQKRDIPVPLVPKHYHPEESFKESNEKNLDENNKGSKNQSHYETQFPEMSITKHETAIPLIPKAERPADNGLHKDNKELKIGNENAEIHQRNPNQNDGQKLDNNRENLTANASAQPSVNMCSEDPKPDAQNPLIKNRPVPVAELFARTHDN